MEKLLLLFILTIANFGFSQEIEVNEKNLSKKWVFSDIINDSTEEKKAETREMLEGMVLSFREDKTYTFDFIASREGTWKLNTERKIITVKESGKVKTNTWTVHSLTKDQFVASRNDSAQQIVFKAG
ncbi:hypothetical protein [Flavobacterium sp.]|uniref:hypothetical protein n=1 Tax=Flavobacterium sp. TaxID=239 RepID=UPI004033DF03